MCLSMPECAAAPSPWSVLAANDLTIVTGFQDVLRENQLDSLDGLFATTAGERLDKVGLSPWRERLRLTLEIEGRPLTFYLKRFTRPPRDARREVKRSGSGAVSVAGMEWNWMKRVAADGIPSVRPVAFGEQLAGAREVRSAILTQAVPGTALERAFPCWDKAARATARSLVEPLAELVARFHAKGYIHRDLYLSHVFFDPHAGVGDALHLIDLQRVIRPTLWRERWIVKDLAALNFSTPPGLISNTDRIRWLTRYLRVATQEGAEQEADRLSGGGLDAATKRLAYRITGKTRSIVAHERRRLARLQRSSAR